MAYCTSTQLAQLGAIMACLKVVLGLLLITRIDLASGLLLSPAASEKGTPADAMISARHEETTCCYRSPTPQGIKGREQKKCGAFSTQEDLSSFALEHVGSFFGKHKNAMSSLALELVGANGSEYTCHGADCKGRWHSRLCGSDFPETGATMVGLVRLSNVAELIHQVIEDDVPGAFAELGVWRGGTCIFASHAFSHDKKKGSNDRSIHVFDAFDKLPGYGSSSDYLANSEASVRARFEQFQAMGPAVHFHVGLFKDTTKEFRAANRLENKRIAILRVDGNFYDSYSDAMYDMYDYIPVGGFVIFDDVVTHRAVLRFWNDFKADQNISEELVRIDEHSAFFRKATNTIIDQSKRRPPQDANLRTSEFYDAEKTAEA